LSQLALPLKLQDHAVFETFWGAGNEALLAFVETLCATGDGPGCWIWGAPSTGKSHLLQAICERVGAGAAYLPLSDLRDAGPGILDGMAAQDFVCLDDVPAVAGDPDWEAALFRLFVGAAENRSVMIAAGDAPPRAAGFALADLESRFSMLPAFQLSPLGDDDRQAALQLRARHRGLELPDETAHFLITRQRRDMASLYELLDRLDGEALVAQRRLTIPFVKSVLGS
jgi:DnaA family protein